MKKIVIATKNKGKIREMENAFQGMAVKLVPLSEFGALPDAVENAETFEGNARIKAAFYMEKTGCACLADDSGLEVQALDGAPGVYSARFAGYHADDAANNAIYAQYAAEAQGLKDKVIFCGRLADYKYYDMYLVIERALAEAQEELGE